MSLPRRHERVGWTSLALFTGLGLVLELLHAFKVGLYLGAGAETRRLLWTLAHAHGALLGLVHLAFAAQSARLALPERAAGQVSSLLVAATVLLPGGFFAGGVVVHGTDPGLGVLLAPLGAVALVAALTRCAIASWRR